MHGESIKVDTRTDSPFMVNHYLSEHPILEHTITEHTTITEASVTHTSRPSTIGGLPPENGSKSKVVPVFSVSISGGAILTITIVGIAVIVLAFYGSRFYIRRRKRLAEEKRIAARTTTSRAAGTRARNADEKQLPDLPKRTRKYEEAEVSLSAAVAPKNATSGGQGTEFVRNGSEAESGSLRKLLGPESKR
ncbi:hypothetical protein CC86DRAFT_366767 [Ophiobolus disseminans]|uniref:Uncharacterized protein n=1 Tax=Ophiobolus disseminans TaxID=1469910 RepID=A0A6A7AEU0_9PLEO|nr:hypothetical protein CC86DRAFT_366767 [Ophiobolus disseminans]